MIDLEHCKVGRWIIADRICDVRRAVHEGCANLTRTVHDVAVRKQEPVGGKEKPRSRTRGVRGISATTRWSGDASDLEVHDGRSHAFDRPDYRT